MLKAVKNPLAGAMYGVIERKSTIEKIISQSGCFFHPDRPPVIYWVEIGKVVEKLTLISCL